MAEENATQTRQLAAVTGASSGIGYELAKQFAAHGFDLVIAAEDAGIEDARDALEELGSSVTAVQADLSTPEGVVELYEQINATGRPLDAVAINAGIGAGGDFVRDMPLEKVLTLVNLNCTSAVHLAKLVLPDMVNRKAGRVLFTSSIAATGPGPFEAVYAASKAFLLSFSEALRNELKDSGVTVTALMPGPTETNFFRRADMEDTKVGSEEKDDPAQVAQEGFDALMAGEDKVVAGSLKNKVLAAASKLMPPTTSAQVHRSMSEPGSAKH